MTTPLWAAGRVYSGRLAPAGSTQHLSRNLAFIATLMDSGIEFIAVDNPHANKLTLHILGAVAQHEREMLAARTKAALQASKDRGTRLGRNAAENLIRLAVACIAEHKRHGRS